MMRIIGIITLFALLCCVALRLYSQQEKERLQVSAEVKEAPGEIQFVISGTAQVPDDSRVQVSLLFAGENFDGRTVVVTDKRFSVTLGPYNTRYHSGTYTIDALFKVDRQIEPVRKQFPDQSEMWEAHTTVRVGTPEKEKEEDRAIAELYGKVIADAETLRQEMWAEYEQATKKQRYFKDKEFDEAAWRDFLDGKWRSSLKKCVDTHGDYKEKVLALKFPQAATDAEMLFDSLLKLSQHLSAKVYKENKLREDSRDVTAPDPSGAGSDAAAQDRHIRKLSDSIGKVVETILKKTQEDYAGKVPKGMVLVPAGVFHMGSTDEQIDRVVEEARKEFSEDFKKIVNKNSFRHNLCQPKDVYLKPFYIDKYEVTNAEYKKFVDGTNHEPPDYWQDGQIPKGKEDCPVVRVSLKDAEAYAKWAKKRLPTEAEWEKAARGSKDRRGYPWGDTWSGGKANLWEKGGKRGDFKPVGSHSEDKSPYDCHDMCGNVQEWTSDTITITDDPHHAGVHQVLRGGSYLDSPFESRCDFIHWLKPDEKFSNLGFRCVKDVEE